MDAIVSTMKNMVSVSAFNKGEAGAIFSSVKRTGEPKLVLRRNEPECVLVSPDAYIRLMNELEDLRDYQQAVERLNASKGETISFADVLKEDGITEADLDKMEDVEFE